MLNFRVKALQPELDEITYEVKRGDTLSEIAQAYSTTVAQILKDNALAVERC